MKSGLFDRIDEAQTAIRPQVAVTSLSFSPMLSKVTGCQGNIMLEKFIEAVK